MYGLLYYKRGIRVMYSMVTPYSTDVLKNFILQKQCSKNQGSREEIFSEAVGHKDRKKKVCHNLFWIGLKDVIMLS